MQAIYEYLWNFRVLTNCELWSRNMQALIDCAMFVIGILVTFFLFQTVNMIYMFATTGRLPREIARKSMLCCIYLIIIITCIIMSVYVFLNMRFSENKRTGLIGYLIQYMAILRIVGLSVNATMLSCMLYRLRAAKV